MTRAGAVMAVLEINRGRGWNDRLRAYLVFVDGTRVGEIRAGQTKSFDIEAGEHSVQLRISWCGSRVLTVVAGDTPVRLICKNGVFPGLEIFVLLFRPQSWIDLRAASLARTTLRQLA